MKKIDKKLNSLIPGGAHTYSRGYDQFSYNTPGILKKGEDLSSINPITEDLQYLISWFSVKSERGYHSFI